MKFFLISLLLYHLHIKKSIVNGSVRTMLGTDIYVIQCKNDMINIYRHFSQDIVHW